MRGLFMLAGTLIFCGPAMAQQSPAQQSPTTVQSSEAIGDEAIPSKSSDKPLGFWMQKKLDYSTAILRGLSMGDFNLIETNADQMRLLNKIEGFVRGRNPDYRAQLHTFERVTEEIVRQAKKENIDGVTLAYHQLTVSCVRCHQSLRETK